MSVAVTDAPTDAAGGETVPVRIEANDGRVLAGSIVRSRAPRGALVVNGASGFPREFYIKFAGYAAERGFHTLVYDYRGMGESRHRPLREETAKMSDWGLYDMPAALGWLAREYPSLPRFTLGHSIGGQFVGLLPNHRLASAHVLVAASIGYWRWEHAPFRYAALFFWYVHGPLALRLWGYVPQGRLWTGQSLPRGVYLEWRKWCLRPEHFRPDLSSTLKPNFFDEIRAPMLALAFEDDAIATRRTVPPLLSWYTRAPIELRWHSPREAGARAIGHHGFFSARFRDSLWREAVDWLEARASAIPAITTTPPTI